tara:strand:- start:43 stop:510 length:468 start_codon:yes stop_codon:yes gene_type:complete
MKKIFVVLIALLAVTNISYASFPVTENTSPEISVINNIESAESNLEAPIRGDTPVFGILSFGLSMLALMLFVLSFEVPVFIVFSFLLSIASIIFGILGFKKDLPGFAITGFIIGCVLMFIWFLAIVSGGELFDLDGIPDLGDFELDGPDIELPGG